MKCDVVINKPNFGKLRNTKLGDIIVTGGHPFIVTTSTPGEEDYVWCTDISTGEECQFMATQDIQIPKSAKLEVVL